MQENEFQKALKELREKICQFLKIQQIVNYLTNLINKFKTQQ